MANTPAPVDLPSRMRLLATWYDDIEYPNSEATEYASWLTLRVILEHLSVEQRTRFYSLLDTNPDAARTMAESLIPDLRIKVATALAEGLTTAIEGVKE